MNSLPRFCAHLRSFIPVASTKYARIRLLDARVFSSAELHVKEGIDSCNNLERDLATAPTGSVVSYDDKISKFTRRIGYRLEELPSLLTAFTTKSFVDSFPSPETNFQYNGRLSFLGRSVVLLFVQEHLFTTYPELPGDVMSDASAALTSDETLGALCERLDLVDVIRASVKISVDNPSQSMFGILSDVMLAVVSVLYYDQGASAVRKFIDEFVVSEFDQEKLEEVVKLDHPKQTLCHILKGQGNPLPITRLLRKVYKNEDGSRKRAPVYVVGVYLMHRLLAEGAATSLVRAERGAVQNALAHCFAKDLKKAPLPSRQENYVGEDKIKLFNTDSVAQT